MDWDTLVIENSHGIVTEENIDKFNMDFWSKIDGDHDMDTPDGKYCEFKFCLWGMKLTGHYYASWIGDDEYPNETEPSEIELDNIVTSNH